MNSAWAMLVMVMAVKISVMLSPKNKPAGSTARHVAATGRAPPVSARRAPMTTHHSTMAPIIRQKASTEPGVSAHLTMDELLENVSTAASTSRMPSGTRLTSSWRGRCRARCTRGVRRRHGGAHAPPRRPLMASGELLHRQLGRELDLGRHEQLVRTEVLGAQVDQALHVRRGGEAATRSAEVGLGGGLADQQALHLDGQQDGDDDEQDADGDRADGVPAGLTGEVGEQHAAQGEEQAELGTDVLEQHHRQLGLLGGADVRPP